jgi:hypothetical protein
MTGHRRVSSLLHLISGSWNRCCWWSLSIRGRDKVRELELRVEGGQVGRSLVVLEVGVGVVGMTRMMRMLLELRVGQVGMLMTRILYT